MLLLYETVHCEIISHVYFISLLPRDPHAYFLKVFLSVSHITDLVANLLQSCERSCVLADVLVFSGLYALSKNDTYKTGCNNVGTLMPNPGE